MSNKARGFLVGAALAGVVAGTTAVAVGAPPTANHKSAKSAKAHNVDTHCCMGKNSCKGKGGCKRGDKGCKGKNTCKGKGGCATIHGNPCKNK